MGRANNEKIVKVINVGDAVTGVEDPLKGICELIEQEWSGPASKWEACVHVEQTPPVNVQQFPILLVDWDDTKGGLRVDLDHHCTRSSLR